jgi:hypothetical protein
MSEHEVIAEIRHASTHKGMPNHKIVVKCLKYLLVFLFEKLFNNDFNIVRYWLDTFKKMT